LTNKNKELEIKRSVSGQELGERIKRIQQDHQSVKKGMVESRKREKEQLENNMILLEKQHREKAVMIESAIKEDVARMKTGFENWIFTAQEFQRISTEQFQNLLGTVNDQKGEAKLQMLNSFNAEKSQMRNEFHDEKAKLSLAIESQEHTLETRYTTLKIECEHNKKRMTAEHQAVMDEMTIRFEEEKTRMAKELQRLKDQFCEQLRDMKDQHNQEIDQKDREIEEVRKKQEAEEKRLEEQHAAEKLRLEIQKEEENKKLKGDIEALKGVIVKRDYFTAMSDRELSQKFNDLASDIDNFSRIRWDNRRENTWPFPARVFRTLENERKPKQHVIQNTFWVILYERIFCTPFRVLGTEGKLKERDWIEEYGQGELPHSIFLNRQLSSTRFEISSGPCTLSQTYQRF
jgi:hypothetical protein